MRGDDARTLPQGWLVVAVAVALAAAESAEAQRLRGLGEFQYQSVDRVGLGLREESWVKTVETEYWRRMGGSVDLSARLRFSEQTVVDRPDRLRVPEGSLRLAHRYFGVSSIYRPTSVRDARGLTTRYQNLTLTGYARKPGLPSLSGSWIRTHVDSTALAREAATVTRSLSASYTLPGLGLRAGYGDRLVDVDPTRGSRLVEKHVNLGSVSQFQLRRAPVTLQYDFTQAWADPSGTRAQRSRTHAAAGNSGFQLSSKTSASLAYTYRRSSILNVPGTLVQDHNGSASLSHILVRTLVASTGAGVRSAQFGGRTLTERFLNLGLAAQGQARPGWQVGAAAGRSYSWLPGTKVRIADSFSSNTSMRLARGLDGRADFSASSTQRPEGSLDSLGRSREVGLQFGGGITATPLRALYLDMSARRSRAGASSLRGSPTATSYAANVRLTPWRRLQLGGSGSLTRGYGSRGSTTQASVLYNASARLQASGSYSRSRQRVLDPLVPTRAQQESVSGALTIALGRDLNGAFRYSESNRGQPSHLRQVTVNLVKRLGR